MGDLGSQWEVTCCHQSFPAQAVLPGLRVTGDHGSSGAEEGAGGWVGHCEGWLVAIHGQALCFQPSLLSHDPDASPVLFHMGSFPFSPPTELLCILIQ